MEATKTGRGKQHEQEGGSNKNRKVEATRTGRGSNKNRKEEATRTGRGSNMNRKEEATRTGRWKQQEQEG